MAEQIPEQRNKLELFLSAKGLRNLNTFSKTNPICKLFQQIQGDVEKFIGQTEKILNNLNPVWDTTFVIDYIFEITQTLRIEVWDADNKCVGSVTTTVAEVIGSKNSEKELTIKLKSTQETGIISLKIDKQLESDTYVQWTWIGTNLIKYKYSNHQSTDGYFGKSDPFLKFYKKCAGGEWFPVHKTEMIKNNLNPEWKSFEISTTRLCDENSERNFKVECWDLHHKGESNQYMGSFETSLHEIFNDNKTEFNLIMAKNKSGGIITIKEKSTISRPTFYDYLRDGEQINLLIGIDYTSINGEYTFPDSLHVQRKDNQPNAYQIAMKHCGEILLNYDYDKKVPVYGFGAIPHLPNYNVSDTGQCFPLTGNFAQPEVQGIDEIMELYKSSMQYLQFSGPCKLSEIIKYAKAIAQSNEKKNVYTVLLLLTCGQIHDVQEVTEILADCSIVPLSIIIVGIGEFDFSRVEHLDTQQKGSGVSQKRNLVQFVDYSKFGHSMPLLQRELLAQLPHQLVQYKTLAGKVPTRKQKFL